MEFRDIKVDYVLVDSMFIAYRSFYAGKSLKTSSGELSGLEFYYLRTLFSLVKKFYPAKIVIVWDGVPVEGNSINSEYKAGRDTTEAGKANFHPRVDRLKDALFEVCYSYYDPEVEADYSIAGMLDCLEGNKVIVSSDDDFKQLVDTKSDKKVYIFHPGNSYFNTEDKVYTELEVVERFGVTPDHVTLYRAWNGDSSDNLKKAVLRIPDEFKVSIVKDIDVTQGVEQQIDECIKKAMLLNQKYGVKYLAGKSQAMENYKISDLRGRVGKKALGGAIKVPLGNLDKIKDLCTKLEMSSLIDRPEWKLFV